MTGYLSGQIEQRYRPVKSRTASLFSTPETVRVSLIPRPFVPDGG